MQCTCTSIQVHAVLPNCIRFCEIVYTFVKPYIAYIQCHKATYKAHLIHICSTNKSYTVYINCTKLHTSVYSAYLACMRFAYCHIQCVYNLRTPCTCNMNMCVQLVHFGDNLCTPCVWVYELCTHVAFTLRMCVRVSPSIWPYAL